MKLRSPVLLVLVLLVSGCAGMGRDPDIIARDATWYARTDPQRFFAQESHRGVVYFIGMYDPKLGDKSPVPGIRLDDPYFSPYMTWFVPSNSIADPEGNRRFREAARDFARRYNPLVLDYLKHQSPPKA